ncbi:ATP-binding protein [Dictyobacter aurantiacus]|uniref:ATP-binding protein n=1 Tax=Dictyobacter aurantiacus TaxID=1936993 RepID=A0A401ZFX7_9CHLR|nr:ATP-binding protein [Dictyobacter aurantiacus]GCE05749.1 hypothetical protein KDAU_30780 [Dictyobacter aurantiacus]
MKVNKAERVNIRPGVSILSVLRHLNYKPWYALAEFVDNSIQSYVEYKSELDAVEGHQFKLQVAIELDPNDGGQIIIRDNAAGIHEKDFSRAFRPAEVPLDRSGLSEFGMGMKSASCWFADRWTVRTSALYEATEKTVDFNIEKIVEDDIEELVVKAQSSLHTNHYTEISLKGLHKIPHSKTVVKIKDHLASIYRIFIREGILELRFNNEILQYQEPKILTAPYYKTPEAQPVLWKKEIKFDFGFGLKITGFVALRETGSTASAGFGLFRRNRLIEGSGEDSYRPEAIFGRHNSFIYQRLFGELHLEGFEVSHTKDGFRWEEHEEIFLELLKEYIEKPPLPLLDQAEGYRARPKPRELIRGAEIVTQRTAEVLQREVSPVLEQQFVSKPETQNPPQVLPSATKASQRIIDVSLNDAHWQIALELSDDPSVGEWISIYDHTLTNDANDDIRRLGVRLALDHPFTERFAGADPMKLEPLLRLAVAIALAETTARVSGVRMTGTIRRNINDLLRNALSKE